MKIISSIDGGLCRVENWATQLAQLTTVAWTGADGKCYFPYLPLTTSAYWRKNVLNAWRSQGMFSWALVDSGKIIAHVALVDKSEYCELGRWVSYPESPKDAITRLCEVALGHAETLGKQVLVETTQAHTCSQFICERLGFRFAGIGFLDVVDGVHWDIIYYDNLDIPDFSQKTGILGNPLGKEVCLENKHLDRLKQVSSIISIDRGGVLPPRSFHVLPHRYALVRGIVESSLDLCVKV